MAEIDDRSGKTKVEDLEGLKAVLRFYKEDPTNIPLGEWKNLVSDFREIVDKDELPFEPSLAPFCQCLVNSHVDEAEDICMECELAESCGYKEEKRMTSFNSFNLGMLYGIALARLLYEMTMKQEEMKGRISNE